MHTFINNKRYDIKHTNLLNILVDFNTIESRADLQKRKFTGYDYNALFSILRDLVVYNKIDNCFLTKNVKRYLIEYDIKVNEKVKNVSYIVTLE